MIQVLALGQHLEIVRCEGKLKQIARRGRGEQRVDAMGGPRDGDGFLLDLSSFLIATTKASIIDACDLYFLKVCVRRGKSALSWLTTATASHHSANYDELLESSDNEEDAHHQQVKLAVSAIYAHSKNPLDEIHNCFPSTASETVNLVAARVMPCHPNSAWKRTTHTIASRQAESPAPARLYQGTVTVSSGCALGVPTNGTMK